MTLKSFRLNMILFRLLNINYRRMRAVNRVCAPIFIKLLRASFRFQETTTQPYELYALALQYHEKH